MPMSNERQYRTMELRSAEEKEDSFIVEGYATTFEPYELYEDYDGDKVYESFSADCFKDTKMDDVIFQYNHEGKVFARQSNGTLVLQIDDHGLYVRADLGKTAASREMYEEIKAGLVTKMSWGFMPGEYSYDRKTSTIIHKSVKKIFDVSAVSIPANDATEIQARSFVDGEINKVLEECRRAERARKALALKLKLEGF